jgi:hypothetical protein
MTDNDSKTRELFDKVRSVYLPRNIGPLHTISERMRRTMENLEGRQRAIHKHIDDVANMISALSIVQEFYLGLGWHKEISSLTIQTWYQMDKTETLVWKTVGILRDIIIHETSSHHRRSGL